MKKYFSRPLRLEDANMPNIMLERDLRNISRCTNCLLLVTMVEEVHTNKFYTHIFHYCA